MKRRRWLQNTLASLIGSGVVVVVLCPGVLATCADAELRIEGPKVQPVPDDEEETG